MRGTVQEGTVQKKGDDDVTTSSDEQEAHLRHPHEMPERYMQMMALKETAVMLLYPGMTALDLTGPQYVFASMMGLNVQLVAKTPEPVRCDTGIVIMPDMTFDECASQPTVLFVPGGADGTLAAMRDAETVAFVRSRGERAAYVTAVCTGSLLLGAAGLLRGYRATSHWLARGLLAHAGAEPVAERVVFDRNRVTGAGVTAGIDFALALAGVMRGDDYARALQLMAEYDPQPPYRAGTPEEAGPEATALLASMVGDFMVEARQTLTDAYEGER